MECVSVSFFGLSLDCCADKAINQLIRNNFDFVENVFQTKNSFDADERYFETAKGRSVTLQKVTLK